MEVCTEYYGPEREPHTALGVFKKLPQQDDIQLESYRLKKTLDKRDVACKVTRASWTKAGPESDMVHLEKVLLVHKV